MARERSAGYKRRDPHPPCYPPSRPPTPIPLAVPSFPHSESVQQSPQQQQRRLITVKHLRLLFNSLTDISTPVRKQRGCKQTQSKEQWENNTDSASGMREQRKAPSGEILSCPISRGHNICCTAGVLHANVITATVPRIFSWTKPCEFFLWHQHVHTGDLQSVFVFQTLPSFIPLLLSLSSQPKNQPMHSSTNCTHACMYSTHPRILSHSVTQHTNTHTHTHTNTHTPAFTHQSASSPICKGVHSIAWVLQGWL